MMGKLHWIIILQPVSFVFAYRHDPWYRADTLRPVDAITDTVNDLGIKILQQYTTHGNIAFSPIGVAFVLTALYEGSAGRGSKQIAEIMGLPLNRDITRIGFRDINRRLRNYLNADGFLGGLTLSRENTKLRSEYEDILRFYGFDLSIIDQETNITVNMENSTTTEFSMSTDGLTSPLIEMINTGNIPVSTTISMNTITSTTMLFPTSVEATIVPSTTTSNAQQIVAISTDTDAQTILTSVTNSSTTKSLTMQSTDSLTMVTSGESVQPSVGAESMMGLLRTINPTINTGLPSTTSIDSQTSSNTVTMTVLTDDQSLKMSSIVTDNTNNIGTTGTVVISINTDTQTILTPIASSVAVSQNTTTQSTNSLTVVTSSESLQPSLFAGAESMAGSPSTLLPMMSIGLASTISMDQTSPNTMTTVVVTNNESNQNSQTSVAVNNNNIGTTRTVANTVPNMNVTKVSNTNIQIPDTNMTMVISTNDSDTITSIGIDNEIPSIFAENIGIPIATNVSNSDSVIVANMSTEILEAATTIDNMIFVNASATNILNTNTSNTLMSTSMALNNASVTIPTSVTNTITNSSINSQPNTKMSTMMDTTEVTTLKDLTTMLFAINVNSTVTLTDLDNSVTINSTINSLDDQAVNSTMSSILEDINQTLVNQNTVSLNRKRRTKTIESGSNLNSIMNDIIITSGTTNKLNNPNRLNLHKRRARSPRGYFSSYPGMINY